MNRAHLAFRLAYRGKHFQGFQSQSGKRTVQRAFEEALRKVFRDEVKIRFVSRTDSGVNAWDQLVFVPNGFGLYESSSEKAKRSLMLSLNSVLGGRVAVWQIGRLKETFDFKRDVLWKEYEYWVYNSSIPDPQMDDRYFWVRPRIELKTIQSEVQKFVGLHDFAAFARQSGRHAEGSRRGTERRILKAEVKAIRHPFGNGAQLLRFQVRGDGFLHYMVRNMVGTLVERGLGKNYSVDKLLRQRSREKAGRTAPASPLYLKKIQLERGVYRPVRPPTRII